MLKSDTLCDMIGHLLQLPGYTFSGIARQIGVHEETVRKVSLNNGYQLLPSKQLALIKLYCTECGR